MISAGRLSAAALMASGIAGIVIPDDFAKGIDVAVMSPRGRAEVRAGLGGTYAALGAYGLLSRSPVARRAVGATWLGAGVVRVAALRVDEPEPDWTYWAFLAGEVVLGLSGLVSRSRR